MVENVRMAENQQPDVAPDVAPDITFTSAWRGYRRRQVNEYILALTERARRDSEALRDAEQELARLRGSGVDSAAPEPEAQQDQRAGLGAVIDRIVTLATQEAHALVTAAEEDTAAARTAAEQLRTQSETESAAILAEARREAEGILAEAKATLHRATMDTKESDAEIARRVREALRQHDSMLERMAGVRDMVDRLTPLLDGAVPVARDGDDRPVVEAVSE